MDVRSLKLMLVEDHRDSAVALSRLLRKSGHSVEVAACCKEALQLFHGREFDFILCDLGLPDGDGCDLLKEMRMHRSQKAIAITGFGMAEDVNRSKIAGFLSHVTKPIQVDQLMILLGELAVVYESFPGVLHTDVPLRDFRIDR